MFSTQRRECLSVISRGECPFVICIGGHTLDTECRVSPATTTSTTTCCLCLFPLPLPLLVPVVLCPPLPFSVRLGLSTCLLPLPFPFAFCSVCYTENRVSPIHRGESVPVSKELVEPPDMYSSGEFNDNETLYMTQGGPLSIQRIECLLYTRACPYATPRGGRLLV